MRLQVSQLRSCPAFPVAGIRTSTKLKFPKTQPTVDFWAAKAYVSVPSGSQIPPRLPTGKSVCTKIIGLQLHGAIRHFERFAVPNTSLSFSRNRARKTKQHSSNNCYSDFFHRDDYTRRGVCR